MLSPLLLRLAWLRLTLLFVAGCFLALHIGFMARATREQGQGPGGAQPNIPDFPYLGITFLPGDLTPDATARELGMLADAGFGWVRVRLAWDDIEPAPHQWQWATADALIGAIRRAELETVLVLDGSPTWARGPQDQRGPTAHFAPPADYATFARFAAAVATRYRDQVRVYQIWDEPNISPHWGARHIEPVAYAQLLKAASTAVRAADDDAIILAAALAPTADRGHTAQDEVYFLQRLYAAGAAPFFDAVALQPFGFGTTPGDPRQRRAVLNLHRALWVRRAMVAAGDGAAPVWLVRYGWDRAAPSPWSTVTPQNQAAFAVEALDIAYSQWPWIAAQGWAAHAPTPGAILGGFALTPELAAAFQGWSRTVAQQPRPRAQAVPPWPLIGAWAVTAAAAGLWAWRTLAAARRLPWQALRRRYMALPLGLRLAIWAGLLLVYWVATWPPLLALCWLVAALLCAAQPVIGLGLALAALPFHAQHKEIHLVDAVWAIPPAYAALLCALPGLLIWQRRNRGRDRAALSVRVDRWWLLAAGWGIVALLGARHVWHWPAYVQGMVELVLIPLLFFALLRIYPFDLNQLYHLAAALWLGGLLAAGVGLADWLAGGGTHADGLLRLVGPAYSPNQTALYLVRSLFLGFGTALAARGVSRQAILAATGIIGLALLLTGSRGALLLGLPAGVVTATLLRPTLRRRLLAPPHAWRLVRLVTSIAVILVVGIGLVWLLGPRLMNRVTLTERWEIWQLTLGLWRDHWLTGVGPGGFFWRFPAYLPMGSRVDPNLRHPHTVWLELAAQGGIAGVLWLVGLLLLLVHQLWTARQRLSRLQVGLAAGLAAGLAHAQVDAFQALPEPAVWNWAALALLLVLHNKTPLPQRTAADTDQL